MDARELRSNSSRDAVLEHVSCAVCGSKDFEVVLEAQYENEKDVDLIQKFRASGDELLIDRLVKCRGCGLQYISPRLRGDLIFSSYAEGEDPVYVSQMDARERTFATSLAHIEKLVGRPGTLLDIGTAAGGFLAAATKRGWKAEGCEPNRWLAAWGSKHYGVRIRSGSVFEQPYEPSSFDVVTLWDVIEHTTNPREMIEHCRGLLKPGGVLVVNYPDIGSWIARALGRRWLFLTSVHLHYFDRRTMHAFPRIGRLRSPGHSPAFPAARARLHPLQRRGAQQTADGCGARDREAPRTRAESGAVLAGPDLRRRAPQRLRPSATS